MSPLAHAPDRSGAPVVAPSGRMAVETVPGIGATRRTLMAVSPGPERESLASDNKRYSHGWMPAIYTVGTDPARKLTVRGEKCNPLNSARTGRGICSLCGYDDCHTC